MRSSQRSRSSKPGSPAHNSKDMTRLFHRTKKSDEIKQNQSPKTKTSTIFQARIEHAHTADDLTRNLFYFCRRYSFRCIKTFHRNGFGFAHTRGRAQ